MLCLTCVSHCTAYAHGSWHCGREALSCQNHGRQAQLALLFTEIDLWSSSMNKLGKHGRGIVLCSLPQAGHCVLWSCIILHTTIGSLRSRISRSIQSTSLAANPLGTKGLWRGSSSRNVWDLYQPCTWCALGQPTQGLRLQHTLHPQCSYIKAHTASAKLAFACQLLHVNALL
jgi:hypothetical protein